MKLTENLYRDSLALLTDFYQLTMANSYWKSGKSEQEAVFTLFFRKNPFQNGFTIAAGLEYVVDYCRNFSYKEEDLRYLAEMQKEGVPVFSGDFIQYLRE